MKKEIRKISLPEGEIIPMKYDFMFTSIFNNPKNKEILESFIACYLDIPYEKVHNHIKLISRKLEIENKDEQDNEVDLLLEYENQKINIEMSTSMTKGIKERNVVYASKIHGKNLIYSENDYKNIMRTIQINLVAHEINTNNFIESYYLKNEEGEMLTKKLQIDYIDMAKANKMCYNEGTREENLRKWCLLFMESKKEEFEKKLKGWDIMSEKAKRKLKKEVSNLSEEEDYIIVYESMEKKRENAWKSVLDEIEDLKQEQKEFKQEKDEFKQEKDEFNQEKDEFNQAKDKLKKEKEQIQKEQEQLQNEKEKMQKEIQKLKEELEKYKK